MDSATNGSVEQESVPDNSMALITVKQPGSANPKSAAEANRNVMSGRLIADFDGILFIPDAAYAIGERPWRIVGEVWESEFPGDGVGTDEDVKRARQILKYAKSGTPKILFRGFNANSGGGNRKLNRVKKILPHAFLRARNYNTMWEIPVHDLWENISFHIDQVEHPQSNQSAFSSWSHVLKTSLRFSGTKRSSKIAVLDTTSMEDDIHYTEDLQEVGLTAESYSDELLIFGPVKGPRYHCVPVRELVANTRVWDIIDGPATAFGNERISRVEREAVQASRHLATVLQPPGASLENIVIITAKFVGVRAVTVLNGDDFRYPDVVGFLYYARDDLQVLATRDDARDISLANPTMDTSYTVALECELQMLQAAENVVRGLAWGWRTATSTAIWWVINTRVNDQEEDTLMLD